MVLDKEPGTIFRLDQIFMILNTCTKSRKASREMTSHLCSCWEKFVILRIALALSLNIHIDIILKSWVPLIIRLIWCKMHLEMRRFWKNTQYDMGCGEDSNVSSVVSIFWIVGWGPKIYKSSDRHQATIYNKERAAQVSGLLLRVSLNGDGQS